MVIRKRVDVTQTYLVGGLEFGRGPGEQEVEDGAVGDEVAHSLTAGDVLTGLEQQGPGIQQHTIREHSNNYTRSHTPL